jgi:thioredoxin 2
MLAATVIQCPHCGKKNRVPPNGPGAPRCGNCHKPLPWIVDTGDDSYFEIVEASTVPVLVDLWAPWCGPCRMVSPALERLAAEFAGRMKLAKVNVDDNPAIAARFAVQGIPTLVLVHGGAVVTRQTGAAPEGALRSWLEQGLAAARPT